MLPLFAAALREKVRNCATLRSCRRAESGGIPPLENAMLRIRIVTAAAVVLSLGIAGAAAQTAGSPGQPLPLLQIVRPQSKAGRWRHHAKTALRVDRRRIDRRALAEREIARRELAKRELAKRELARRERASRAELKLAARAERRHAAPAIARRAATPTHKDVVEARQTPTAAASVVPAANVQATPTAGNIWPAASSAVPGQIAAAAAPASPPIATEAVVDSDPDEIAAGHHLVQASSPGSVTGTGPADPPAAAASGMAPPGSSGALPAVPQTASALRSMPAAAVVHAMVVKATAAKPDAMSSGIWLAHVLAALGGAITAGVVAWFLIGPGPRKTYG
jgi:hypothetical protein